MLSAMGITLIICLAVGLRGFWLLLAVGVLWIPVGVIWSFVFVYMFPIKLEVDPTDAIRLDLFHR